MFLFIGLMALSGCAADSPADHWRDYAGRIARTLDFEFTAPPPAELLPFPSRRELQQPVAPMSMSLLDFLQWRACGLQSLIGQRNSALGKVMPDSQQLLYEHRLMVAISRCLDSGEALKPETRAWLEKVLEHKRSQRSVLFWNGVLASPEMQAFFSPGGQRLSVDAASATAGSVPRGVRAASSLLHGYKGFGRSADAVEGGAWEQRYRQMSERPVAYETLLAMEQATRWLTSLNRQMDKALKARAICPQGVLTPRGKVMQRILSRRYQALMQPFLTRVDRWQGGLVDAFAPALAMDAVEPPPAWERYAERYLQRTGQAAHGEFRRAIVRHSEVWQSLLSSCGAMPSRPGA